MNKSPFLLHRPILTMIAMLMLCIGCKNSSQEANAKLPEPKDEQKVKEEEEISKVLLDLESEYAEMLVPISNLKIDKPKIYWFIVSWLNTAYHTPDWTGYYSDEWMATAKLHGIDCSGFSRVMLDQIFNKKVAGGSQGILDNYCTPTGTANLNMGDLVFFRAPYATNDKIVHVGVYLQDLYFVHATSTKSAAEGLGLSINSLKEDNWSKEFVSGGKVKGVVN